MKTLGEIGEPAVEPLIKLLRDEDDYVNYYAAKALGKIGDARAVEPIIRALSDDDWKVRRSAAEALGKIGALRAIEPLITALDDRENTGTISAGMPSDEEWRVADAAKEALIQVAEVRVKGDEKKNALKFLESDDLLAILSQLSNEQKEKIKQLAEFEYLFRMYF